MHHNLSVNAKNMLEIMPDRAFDIFKLNFRPVVQVGKSKHHIIDL